MTPHNVFSSSQNESTVLRHEEGKAWLHSYLHEDVDQLQMMNEHHVHLLNPTLIQISVSLWVHAEEKTILTCVKLISLR